MTEPIEVPEKLSDLIRLAIADGRKLHQERSENYYPNHGVFHRFMSHREDDYSKEEPFGVCHVCLAGGVMAGTLQVPFGTMSPGNMSPPWYKALIALDYVRTGAYRHALNVFYNTDRHHEITPWTNAMPVNPMFQGWDEFLDHLDSLEAVAGFFEFNGF